MVALFALTVIYIFFDPVLEDKIHSQSVELIDEDGGTPDLLVDKYLSMWQMWVPMFLLAILVYMFTAGRESDRPSRIQ